MTDEEQLSHIFRKKKNHIEKDTPENRKKILDVVDESNYLGIDESGVKWYGKITEDGRQPWVSVWKNQIRDGGINETPRAFNPGTGLCRSSTPKGKKYAQQ